MSNENARWSKPFHGVSHIINAPRPYQITMDRFSDWARGYVLFLHSNTPFTPIKQMQGGIEAVQEWCENQYRQLIKDTL